MREKTVPMLQRRYNQENEKSNYKSLEPVGGTMKGVLRMTRVALLGMLFAGTLWANSPSTIRIEVKITDPNTGLLNGVSRVAVSLYESSSSNRAVWTESQDAVNFSNGVFSMNLGANPTEPFTKSILSLPTALFGIAIDTNPEFYIPVHAVPYSLKSKWADEVLTFNWASANVMNTPNVSVFPGTLTGLQVSDSLIASRMIGPGAVLDAHITGPISATKISGAISSANLGAGVIAGTNIANLTITNTNLAEGRFSSIVGLGNLTSTLNFNAGSGIFIPGKFQVDGFTGHVGVNLTESPSAYLDVNGDVRFREDMRVSGDVYLPADLGLMSDNSRVLTVSNGLLRQVDVSAWDRDSSNDVTTFLGLTDTPSTYSGAATYLVRVNAAGTGVEFVPSLTVGDASSLGGFVAADYLRKGVAVSFSGGSFNVASGSTMNIQTGAGLNVEGNLLVSGKPLGSVAFLNAIGADQLGPNAVVESKIKDLAVTNFKIADNAVTSGKIFDGTITNDDLSPARYTNITGVGTLDSVVITGEAIAGGFSTEGRLSAATANFTVATGTAPFSVVSKTKVANLNVDFLDDFDSTAFLKVADNLSDIKNKETARTNLGLGLLATMNVVTSTEIKDGAVTAAKLFPDSVTTNAILNGAVTVAKMDTAANIRAHLSLATTNSVVFGNVSANGTVSANAFVGSGIGLTDVTATSIANEAVTTGKILDKNVTLAKLGDLSYLSFIVGNMSNRPTAVAMSSNGDVTFEAPSELIIVNGKVTSEKIFDGTIKNDDLSRGSYTKITGVGTLDSVVITGEAAAGGFSTAGRLSAATANFTVATGTAPFSVVSKTKVASLNVDLLDDLDSKAFLKVADNLSDITSSANARTHLGLGSLATLSTITNSELTAGSFAKITGVGPLGSLDVTNGLSAATGNFGVRQGTSPLTVTSTTKVASLNVDLLDDLDSKAFLKVADNLSDIKNKETARTNLGLGGLATLSTITNSELTAGIFAKITGVGTLGRLEVSGETTLAGDASTGFTVSRASAVDYGTNSKPGNYKPGNDVDTFIFQPGSGNSTPSAFRFKGHILVDSAIYYKVDSYPSDYVSNQPDPIYIGFAGPNNSIVGSLSGQNGGDLLSGIQGVKLESAGADYAEYLPHRNANETLNKADVVGVFGGKISRDTVGADRVMVVSTMPIVLGNWKPSDNVKASPVAFVGQVPVRVKGAVKTGDYVVATGLGDGMAIAKAAADMTADDIANTVGQAWETKSSAGINVVNMALLPDGVAKALLCSLAKENNALQTEMKAMRADIDAIKAALKK